LTAVARVYRISGKALSGSGEEGEISRQKGKRRSREREMLGRFWTHYTRRDRRKWEGEKSEEEEGRACKNLVKRAASC